MTSREVKRWDATSRSPVYASLSTTLKVRRDLTLLNRASLRHCQLPAAATQEGNSESVEA